MKTLVTSRQYRIREGENSREYEDRVIRDMDMTREGLERYGHAVSGTSIGPPDWIRGNVAHAFVYFSADTQLPNRTLKYLDSNQWSSPQEFDFELRPWF